MSSVYGNVTAEDYQNIIITAVEGGIGYWAQVDGYKWDCDPRETIASLRIAEAKDVDTANPWDEDDWDWDNAQKLDTAKMKKAITERAEKLGLSRKRYLDTIDSIEADVIIQMAVLGEVKYG